MSGYRYYDPDLGRWTSRDPINEPGTFVWMPLPPSSTQVKRGDANPYLWCENQAVMHVDLIGLDVHLFPLNGEAFNDSTAVIKGRGDYKLMHFSYMGGALTFDINPYSYLTFFVWQFLSGYTGYTDVAPPTTPLTAFTLNPGQSTAGQHSMFLLNVVDSDMIDSAWRGGTQVNIYPSPLCCMRKRPPIRQRLGTDVYLHDCPAQSFDPDGVWYSWTPW